LERQQAVRLLGAVSKVLTDQVRVRTTFDLAQREAEQIAAQARRQADETIERARAEAEQILAAARVAPIEDVTPAGATGAADDAAVDGVAAAPDVDPFHVWPDSFGLPTDIFLLGHEATAGPGFTRRSWRQ
jgi:regulator of protease activity HflC (stomatin/prohibitin superfamily)